MKGGWDAGEGETESTGAGEGHISRKEPREYAGLRQEVEDSKNGPPAPENPKPVDNLVCSNKPKR